MAKTCIKPPIPSTSDDVIEKGLKFGVEDGLYRGTGIMGSGLEEVACKLTKFSLNSNLNTGTWASFPGFTGKGQHEINGFLIHLRRKMYFLSNTNYSIQHIFVMNLLKIDQQQWTMQKEQ